MMNSDYIDFYVVVSLQEVNGTIDYEPLFQKVDSTKSVLLAWRKRENAEIFMRKLMKDNSNLYEIKSKNSDYLQEIKDRNISNQVLEIKILDK